MIYPYSLVAIGASAGGNTAEFPYMPNAVITGDSPDGILTPAQIATLIVNS